MNLNEITHRAGKDITAYMCPCCGYITLGEERKWEICDVCYWEDDLFQYNSPDYEGGANGVSLNQAKENFKNFGASKKERLPYVRKPNNDEIPIKAKGNNSIISHENKRENR